MIRFRSRRLTTWISSPGFHITQYCCTDDGPSVHTCGLVENSLWSADKRKTVLGLCRGQFYYSIVQLLTRGPLFATPVDYHTPGFPVLHHLLEFAQTHVPWVGDAIQPSCSLFCPSLPDFNLSQHQGLFQLVGSLHQMVKVLKLQLQAQVFQWMVRVNFLQDWLVWFPCSPRDSQESSPTLQFKKASILWCSAFFMVQLSHLYMTTGKTIALTRGTFVRKVMSLSAF